MAVAGRTPSPCQSNPYQLKPPLPLSAQEIMAWSLARLEKLHETVPVHPVRHAVEFRQALSIGLLIRVPVRVRAFIAISLDAAFGAGRAGLSAALPGSQHEGSQGPHHPR